MNGVQTRLKCKPNVKRCKRFVFAAHSPLLHPNTLKTKAIIHFQTDHILTRFVFPPLKERAESELAKIKSEARTEQLKNKATDAMTAIASGVGSLFGSGKLKELEQANGKLQGKIDKRDNQIRLLNEHIRMQEERHSTEKHCQQEIHRQELNMKMKKAVISNKGCGLQD